MRSVRVLSSVAKIIKKSFQKACISWAASELILEAQAGFREVQKQGQDPSERRVSIDKKKLESLPPSKPNKVLRTAG